MSRSLVSAAWAGRLAVADVGPTVRTAEARGLACDWYMLLVRPSAVPQPHQCDKRADGLLRRKLSCA